MLTLFNGIYTVNRESQGFFLIYKKIVDMLTLFVFVLAVERAACRISRMGKITALAEKLVRIL